MDLRIRQGTIEEIVRLSTFIPELIDPYPAEVYQQRLAGKKHLILIAESKMKNIGFKIGYDRFEDGSFYTWMGGMLPGYRKKGVYLQLTFAMELWAKENGFHTVLLKTRNRLKPMIYFCLANGYYISGFSPRPDPMESRIYFRKDIG